MTAPATETYAITRRITAISLTMALILVLLKAYALGASGSVSVLASLADSGFDLLASLFTFIAVRIAATPADAGHRYGHGKVEGLAAMVQSGVVLASAAFIGFQALGRILNPVPVTAGTLSLVIMAVAMALTGWLVWMQTRALKATNSLAVKGDRAHYTADLAANAVVLIGLGSGALLNAPGLDAVAGLLIAIWLAWGAVNLLRTSADHLLDGSVPDTDRNRIVALVLEDKSISNVHQLRARMAGQVMMVQMHVDLDPDLTLVEAHAIVVSAERRIKDAFPVADVIIHPDPRPTGMAQPEPVTDMEAPEPPKDTVRPVHSGPWG